MSDADTIIIGAGPAGLACAASLQDVGGSVIVLEKADMVASSWRKHYDRLHLHTHKRHSSLPGMPFPAKDPNYPSRHQVIAYLEAYAANGKIAPRFGQTVVRVTESDGWTVETGTGSLSANNVVFATGIVGWPSRPNWPGLETFPGRLLHSSEYKNTTTFVGQSVLIVGLGNSGGEIALDLADAGTSTTLSVRSPLNVVPRDLLGLPIQSWAILQHALPPRIVDAVNAPVLRLATGDLERIGLRRPVKGPMAQVAEDQKIPLIDIGTIDCIRRGKIAVRPGIQKIDGSHVHFADGIGASFDAIILATGYRVDLRPVLPNHSDAFDEFGTPKLSGCETQYEGLFFCGYRPVATGQLREIGREAQAIAGAIKARATEPS